MKGLQLTTASLTALLPAVAYAGKNFISEYNSVNCNPIDNSCTPMLYVVWTDTDDCDAIKNSKDNYGNEFEQGGSFFWKGTDQHEDFTLHWNDDDDWWKEDEGREVGWVEYQNGEHHKLHVYRGRTCEDLYPFSTRFVRRIVAFGDV